MELPENPPNIEEVFRGTREKLDRRLQELDHPYHNKQHAEEVQANVKKFLDNLSDNTLLTEKEKAMLLECALRHDDGHSGNTYRQDTLDDGLSNEEYAVKLLGEDTHGLLPDDDLRFMRDNILATSFGQSDKAKLPDNKKTYYRDYGPKTPAQKLLALADVSGFIKGWDGWIDESMRLLEESPQNSPANMTDWIVNRHGFIKYHVEPLLKSVQDFLKPEFFNQLEKNLANISTRIEALKDFSNPERIRYETSLKTIREKSSK
ncbi:MAG: hypothetical protein V1846_04410 [Candidatus Komeilibacteria bacterium]